MSGMTFLTTQLHLHAWELLLQKHLSGNKQELWEKVKWLCHFWPFKQKSCLNCGIYLAAVQNPLPCWLETKYLPWLQQPAGAELHNLWRQQNGRRGCGWNHSLLVFHFPNFEAAIYSCSCSNALMTKNVFKKSSTQPKPPQKIHKLPNPKTKEINPH